MTTLPASIVAKRSRAEEHIGFLDAHIGVLIAYNYSVMTQRHIESEQWDGSLEVWVRPKTQPDFVELGVRIGEIVHLLRSALDNLVWELARVNCGQDPANVFAARSLTQFQFPIFNNKGAYVVQRDAMLRGIRPGLMAQFDALQPYGSTNPVPTRTELWTLHALWNLDKHRTIPTILTTVALERMGSVWPWEDIEKPADWKHAFEIVEQVAPRPVIQDTYLGRVRETGPTVTTIPEMHMDPQLALEIQFEKGPPGHGREVIRTLRELAAKVGSITEQFLAEFA